MPRMALLELLPLMLERPMKRWELVIQSDDKAVIAGFFDKQMLIGRYTTAGAVDTTFGSNGFATIACGTQTVANAVAIQTNNNIVTAGFIDSGVLLARVSNAGSLIATFGTSG